MASTSAQLPADAGSPRALHPPPNDTLEDDEKLSDVVRPRSPNRSPKSETSSNEEFSRPSREDLPFDISAILSQPVSSQGTRLFRSGVLTMSMRPRVGLSPSGESSDESASESAGPHGSLAAPMSGIHEQREEVSVKSERLSIGVSPGPAVQSPTQPTPPAEVPTTVAVSMGNVHEPRQEVRAKSEWSSVRH
ncbi:hypothetical protein ONZ51_g13233 [Trametes cubensis]|uniref:Uncharacterized protein n=1 Tax=Trametes cubensis TaxID=1111947 RepID=A0AAD7X4T0_9APHY|nr:hypothetical protein ONZ51_g13233 [Trametes cubensis]